MTREDFERILVDVTFFSWHFDVVTSLNAGDACFLQVRFEDHHLIEQRGRKWHLSPHMTRTEVINTAFFAVKTALEHETRETFLYMGRAIYNTHVDVDLLLEAAETHNLVVRA